MIKNGKRAKEKEKNGERGKKTGREIKRDGRLCY